MRVKTYKHVHAQMYMHNVHRLYIHSVTMYCDVDDAFDTITYFISLLLNLFLPGTTKVNKLDNKSEQIKI